MKKLILGTAILLASLFSTAQSNFTEDFVTTWPYLYADFVDGTIYFNGKYSDNKVNIDVTRNKVLFIKDDVVLEFDPKQTLDSLTISSGEVFYSINKEIFEKLANKGTKTLLCRRQADLAHLGTSGAYGTGTSTSAVTRYTDLYVSNHRNVPVSKLNLEKNSGGDDFPVKKSYYLQEGNNEPIKVTKKSALSLYEGKDIKGYIKKNKIKMNKRDDQIELFNFGVN